MLRSVGLEQVEVKDVNFYTFPVLLHYANVVPAVDFKNIIIYSLSIFLKTNLRCGECK